MSGTFVPALVVAAAGGVGAALRYLADHAATHRWGPGQVRGILLVNLLGAFVAGLLVGATDADSPLRLAGVAALGGFTTFSTAMLQTLTVAAGGAAASRAVAHALGSALGSVAAAAGGLLLAGWLR